MLKDAGPVAGFDPVMISLIRRSMPNLIAYDICGVQPMTGPTGLIFAMRSMYDGPNGPNEAFFDEPDPTFSNNYNKFTGGNAMGTGPGVLMLILGILILYPVKLPAQG